MATDLLALSPADAMGRRPAVAFAEAALARNLARDREAVGMTREQLAAATGVRVDVIVRAETGATVPGVRTLTKIEDALSRAGLKRPDPQMLNRR